MSEAALCGNCRHFAKKKNGPIDVTRGAQGVCRRYPPTPVALQGPPRILVTSFWAETMSGSAPCGEWSEAGQKLGESAS